MIVEVVDAGVGLQAVGNHTKVPADRIQLSKAGGPREGKGSRRERYAYLRPLWATRAMDSARDSSVRTCGPHTCSKDSTQYAVCTHTPHTHTHTHTHTHVHTYTFTQTEQT